MGVYQTISMATQKLPLLPLLHSLPLRRKVWQSWSIGTMWPLLKCLQGRHWRRQQSVKVRVIDNRLTHHWFFSTPPQGSVLPLELCPQCSSSPSPNSAESWGRSAGSPSISCHCWKGFLPGETETINRREAPGKEEWSYSWQPFWWIQLCWRALQIPLFHPPHPHFECRACAHGHLPCPFLTFSVTGRRPLPENSSPRSIRASFTASYPCKTTMGFMPKYRVNTGP